MRRDDYTSLAGAPMTLPLKTSHLTRLLIALILSLSVAYPASASELAQEAAEPAISARAAIVVEYPSGRILYAKSAHDRLAPASTTKILTAILAIEYGNTEEEVAVEGRDLVGESSMGLVEGEKQTIRSLLYGLMLPSGNDASMTLARAIGGKTTSVDPLLSDPVERFIAMMNARVDQLGLQDSNFANPSGLDAVGHYSSAYDLASLTWYAFHLPLFNEVIAQVTYEAPGHALLNTNELLTRYSGADGVKTGLTDEAGLCLVGSATRDGKRLISVVLNSPSWYSDSEAILDYGFARLAEATAAESERLAVAQSAAVAWLLNPQAGGAPAVVGPAAPQGGGSVSPSGEAVGNIVPTTGDAPGASQPDFAPTRLMPSGAEDTGSLFPVALTLAAGFALLYAARKRLFRAWVPAVAGRTVQTSVATFAVESSPGARGGPVSTGGNRRRTPNLFTADTWGREAHISRALQLASEEREGAAMSEFLLALRTGPVTIDELTGAHRLPPTAFLALARAQTSLGHYSDARSTLLHGVTVLPQNRILSLALHQLGDPTAR
jgi:serine-type D-Ala-D-Ala carboxypeptidase (penicillin-binding protein 5/6)